MRSAFSDLEVECYRVILTNPGCSTQDIIDSTRFAEDRVRKALFRLYTNGVVDRERRGAGPTAPFHYWASRGLEPITEYQRAQSERHRLREVIEKRTVTRRGPRRNHSRGWLMDRDEWETLIVNYELAWPGQADVILREHIESCRRRGVPPKLGWEDLPRLVAEADQRRRSARRPTGGLTPGLVREARERFAAGETITNLAREYGLSWDAMSKAVKGESWRDV